MVAFSPNVKPRDELAQTIKKLLKRVDSLERASSSGGSGGGSVPSGTFIAGGWTTAPSGYLLLDGSTVANGATLYPALAALFPNWVSGSDLYLPNTANTTLVGSTGTLGLVSGTMSLNLLPSNLPPHQHSTGSAVNVALGSGATVRAATGSGTSTGFTGSGATIDITPRNIAVRFAVKI